MEPPIDPIQRALRLGGANLAAFAANGGTVPSLQGQGRSLDVGVSIKF